MDEKSELKDLIAEAKQLAKPITDIAQIKAANASALADLGSKLQKLPASAAFAAALDAFAERARKFVETASASRRENFKRIEAEYIRNHRSAGTVLQELDNGWRIGPLEIQMRREEAEARALYNHEQVVGWSKIGAPADLTALEAKAVGLLKQSEIPETDLASAFAEAGQEAFRRAGTKKTEVSRVPLSDLLKEVRLVIARRELDGGKYDRKLKSADMTKFGLLYNLDRYRALGSKIGSDARVGFETGSQAEQAKGMGVVANGLRAEEPYKVYCYATLITGSKK